MMNLTTMPLSFWDYALETVARILNMVPTKNVDKTPYKLWYGKVPNLSYLKVWGCEALVKRDMPDKLQQRSVKCIFIGYLKKKMGYYYFYFPPEHKFVVARYAEFLEKNLLSQEISGSAEELEKIQDEDTSPSENTSEIPMEVQGFEPPQEGVVPIRRMNNSKRGYIPVQEKLDLNKTQGASTPKEVKRMQNVPYASAVGSIMYAVRCTRLDFAFAQNITSRFQQNPGEPHWTAMKTIPKYLKNTKHVFLVYGGNPEAKIRVDCYCDVGFKTDKDDTKSQTGYVFVLNGGAVEWKSSKQSTTTMSATESEHIVALEPGTEAVWIRKFILGLGIVPTINEPIKMFCENSAALHFANEPGVRRAPDTTIEDTIMFASVLNRRNEIS
nr:retrotransposon protein, putative, Ty1-copia subclass [Tanacetum cinerariifolium]